QYVTCLNKIKKIPINEYWDNLVEYVQFTPHVLSNLNDYETILIQRAKVFQVVMKMAPVSGRKQPKNSMTEKSVGRAFHLPLPIEETLKKLPESTQAIADHELYILVRSLPTKKNQIWQSLVNLQKVYKALLWLKNNNVLYKDIEVPQYNIFENEILNMETEYLVSKLTDSGENTLNKNENGNIVGINDSSEISETIKIPAMLTQKKTTDEFYEHYTIHSLNEPRKNVKATDLYQILKIDINLIDQRDLNLDVKFI
ncbi:Uncharacterized protein FWK35_00030464, partial [Aphis craccivora]